MNRFRSRKESASRSGSARRFRSGRLPRWRSRRYPKRAVLGLALFIGQAFFYNGVTFNLGTLLSGFYDVASGTVPVFYALWAVSNFIGPIVLGRFFDTVGRKAMIAFSYLGSAAIAVVLAVVFVTRPAASGCSWRCWACASSWHPRARAPHT